MRNIVKQNALRVKNIICNLKLGRNVTWFRVRDMMFNATSNKISVISWHSVLLVV